MPEDDSTTPSAALIARAERFDMTPRSLTEAMEYARLISASELCPQQFRGKPQDILIAVQLGAEVGVSPVQSLLNIAVINGRACMWGDLVTGLVHASGQLEYLREEWDEATLTALAVIKRKGRPEHAESFSMADARRAGLGERNQYKTYPQRMCGWRAKTWAIRAEFPDVLKGLTTREEAESIEAHVAPAPLMEPRRASEKVDEFLRGDPATLKSEPHPKSSPPAEPKQGEWQGPIVSIEEKSGISPAKVNKDGMEIPARPWTMWTAIGPAGERFGTFSETVRATLEKIKADEDVACIAYTESKLGKKIVEVEPVPF